MPFQLYFTPEAEEALRRLESGPGLAKRLKAVRKALGLLETNPRHPGLQTHKYHALRGPGGSDVFEAYAEHSTPAAYRIFFLYGPGRSAITILAITAHP